MRWQKSIKRKPQVYEFVSAAPDSFDNKPESAHNPCADLRAEQPDNIPGMPSKINDLPAYMHLESTENP